MLYHHHVIIMGINDIMKDLQVWMCKKMMGIHNVMKDYHEVWI